MREGKREKEGGTETIDSKLIDYTVLKWSASQSCKYVTNDNVGSIDSRPVLWKQSVAKAAHEYGDTEDCFGLYS